MKIRKLIMFFILGIFLISFVSSGDYNGNIGKQYGFENPYELYVDGISLGGENLEKIIANKDAKIIYKNENMREITNLKKGSWFKFENGKLIEAEFTSTKDTNYQIENLNFKVPKNGKVKFKNSLITVIVPSKSKIEKPNKINKNKNAGVEIKYVIEENSNGFKIEDEIEIKRISESKETSIELFFDLEKNMFYTSSASIDNIWIGFSGASDSEEKRIYIFNDGEMHKDFNNPYVSYNKEEKKFAIGVPKGKRIYAIFKKGNHIVDIDDDKSLVLAATGKKHPSRAGNDWKSESHLTLKKREKSDFIPYYIESHGPFEIINGEIDVIYHLNRKAPGMIKMSNNKKPVDLIQIHPLDSDGSKIEYTLKKKGKDGKETEITIKYEKDIFYIEKKGGLTQQGKMKDFYSSLKYSNLRNSEVSRLLQASQLPEAAQKELLGMSVDELKGKNEDEMHSILGYLQSDYEKVAKKYRVDKKSITTSRITGKTTYSDTNLITNKIPKGINPGLASFSGDILRIIINGNFIPINGFLENQKVPGYPNNTVVAVTKTKDRHRIRYYYCTQCGGNGMWMPYPGD